MKIDMSLQFDFLPISVRKSDKEQSYKEQLDSCMDAYFKDKKLRQVRKAQIKVTCINVSPETSVVKKKKTPSRTDYYKKVKRKQRNKSSVLAKNVLKKTSKTKPSF